MKAAKPRRPDASPGPARAAAGHAGEPPAADSTWHLGATELERAFGEFQLSLICLSEAFYRYVGRSLAQIAADQNLTGVESVILQVMQSGNRPKSVGDLQHFTNRTDTANIQYSVRKLQKAGLVRRSDSTGRGSTYELTDQGRQVVMRYVEARRALLAKFAEQDGELVARLQNTKSLMVRLTGLYDHDSRELMTRQ